MSIVYIRNHDIFSFYADLLNIITNKIITYIIFWQWSVFATYLYLENKRGIWKGGNIGQWQHVCPIVRSIKHFFHYCFHQHNRANSSKFNRIFRQLYWFATWAWHPRCHFHFNFIICDSAGQWLDYSIGCLCQEITPTSQLLASFVGTLRLPGWISSASVHDH